MELHGFNAQNGLKTHSFPIFAWSRCRFFTYSDGIKTDVPIKTYKTHLFFPHFWVQKSGKRKGLSPPGDGADVAPRPCRRRSCERRCRRWSKASWSGATAKNWKNSSWMEVKQWNLSHGTSRLSIDGIFHKPTMKWGTSISGTPHFSTWFFAVVKCSGQRGNPWEKPRF